VIPRFAKFLRQFPTVASLACRGTSAQYARHGPDLAITDAHATLHKAACVIVAELDGQIPDAGSNTWAITRRRGLYGAAIASIAFAQKTPAVDGNLVRVLARVHALSGRAGDPALMLAVREQARRLVDCDQPGEINQALMDIGATLCRPENPACPECPFAPGVPRPQAGNADSRIREASRKSRAKIPTHRLRLGRAQRGDSCSNSALLKDCGPACGNCPAPAVRKPSTCSNSDWGQKLERAPGTDFPPTDPPSSDGQCLSGNGGRQQPGQRWWKGPLTAPLSSLARKAIVATKQRRPS